MQGPHGAVSKLGQLLKRAQKRCRSVDCFIAVPWSLQDVLQVLSTGNSTIYIYEYQYINQSFISCAVGHQRSGLLLQVLLLYAIVNYIATKWLAEYALTELEAAMQQDLNVRVQHLCNLLLQAGMQHMVHALRFCLIAYPMSH